MMACPGGPDCPDCLEELRGPDPALVRLAEVEGALRGLIRAYPRLGNEYCTPEQHAALMRVRRVLGG